MKVMLPSGDDGESASGETDNHTRSWYNVQPSLCFRCTFPQPIDGRPQCGTIDDKGNLSDVAVVTQPPPTYCLPVVIFRIDDPALIDVYGHCRSSRFGAGTGVDWRKLNPGGFCV